MQGICGSVTDRQNHVPLVVGGDSKLYVCCEITATIRPNVCEGLEFGGNGYTLYFVAGDLDTPTHWSGVYAREFSLAPRLVLVVHVYSSLALHQLDATLLGGAESISQPNSGFWGSYICTHTTTERSNKVLQ